MTGPADHTEPVPELAHEEPVFETIPEAPPPELTPYVAPAPQPAAPPPAEAPRRKGRGCLARGCLLTLGFLVVVVAVGAVLLLRVPQQLGIWPSGERLLAGTPDRAAATTLMTELKAGGVDTTGVSLFVMPVEGASGSLAYAVLDTSAGFQFPTSTGDDNPLIDVFKRLVSSPTIDQAGVSEIAVEYRGANGQRLGVLAASTEAIRQLAAGQIDLKAFGDQMHGTVDVPALFSTATTQ